MSDLDKFFKKKLDERSFDYDEQAWTEMQDLLGEEKDDRRFGWLFIFLGFIAVGALAAINISFYNQPAYTASDEILIENTLEKEIFGTNQKSQEDHVEMLSKLFSPKKADNEVEANISQSIISEKTIDVISKPEPREAKTSATQFNIKSGRMNAPVKVQKTDNYPTQRESNESNQDPAAIEKGDRVLQANPNDFDQIKSTTIAVNSDVVVPDVNSIESKEKISLQLEFLKVALAQLPVENEFEEFPLSKRIVKNETKRNRRFGLMLGQSFILGTKPYEHATISALGLSSDIELKNNFSWQNAIYYKYFRTDSLQSIVGAPEEQVLFSFGQKNYEQTKSISRMHQLGLTSIFNKYIGRYSVGLGLNVEMVASVVGQINQSENAYPWEVDLTETTTIETSSTGMLDKESVNSVRVSPVVNLGVNVTPSIKLDLGLSLGLNNYIDFSEANDQNNWINRKLQANLSMSYFFINRKVKAKQ